MPCLCNFALVHQKLAVVQPDTRHLGGRVWRGWRGGEREWGRCICRNTTCQHICKLTQLNDTYINMRAYVWEHNLACCHYSTAQQLRVAHLVHEDKCSLKGTVNTLVCWVDDAFSLDLCTTQLQVVVPQLVTTAGGGKEGEGGEGRREREEREGGRGRSMYVCAYSIFSTQPMLQHQSAVGNNSN